MKTRIEHKIHAIADVLFRDMKDGKLDNEGVGLLAGQTGIIIFCKHYLQVFPNSEKEEILEGFLETYFDKLTSEIRIIYILRRTYRRFGGFEIPEPRAVVGDRLFRCGEKLSGIAAKHSR